MKDEEPKRHDSLAFHLSRISYYLSSKLLNFERIKNFNSEQNLALKNHIPIVRIDSIKSEMFFERLKILNPDIIVLGGGWYELLPERVFGFPKYGCINTHPSLLPEFRGTSITRWQVLHGVIKSGSTIHYVNERFDTGGIIDQLELDIPFPNSYSPQQLFNLLGQKGAQLMVPILRNIESRSGFLEERQIDHNPEFYKYFKKWQWKKDDLVIDWTKPLDKIYNFVLASTQEHYKYLGPMFNFNKKVYFLRKVTLIVKKKPSDFASDSLFVVLTGKRMIGLTSNNSNFILQLDKIQRYDSKPLILRRAFNPYRLFESNLNQLFINE
ncbi:methionyl-tRNA formyltransferase [Winogradskyella aurantiaca]|uniref:methionyl-tRNA formyltransferase n=1 Tax=Winogradskyella aurantiaca TaxID=2219558 RepID=UPI001300A538|nr:formyltransferase family protein [Winogradskyella aurantiaca]